MIKNFDNPLLRDDECCDMLRQIIRWGYDAEWIGHAASELEDEIYGSGENKKNEDNLVS